MENLTIEVFLAYASKGFGVGITLGLIMWGFSYAIKTLRGAIKSSLKLVDQEF